MSFQRSKNRLIIYVSFIVLLITSSGISVYAPIKLKNEKSSLFLQTPPNSDLFHTYNSLYSKSYKNQDPISICGNKNFSKTVELKRWNGDGTESNPYIIEGINITSHFDKRIESLFSIVNTSVHFIIRNCFFKGGNWGINMIGVKNGIIINNDIIRNQKSGLSISCGFISLDSKNITISANRIIANHNGIQIINQKGNIDIMYNTISDNSGLAISCVLANNVNIIGNKLSGNDEEAIRFICSKNCIVKSNIISENCKGGVVFDILNPVDFRTPCESIIVSQNTIINNLGNGVELGGNSFSNILSLNTISNNLGHGILFKSVFSTHIYNNIISYNNLSGLFLQGKSTTNNSIICNTISENTIGISITEETRENYFYNNILLKNQKYGIEIIKEEYLKSKDTVVFKKNVFKENNLIANNEFGTHQAYDECGNCIFSFNYWSDWTYPDSDKNGFVDSSYLVSGEIKNFDHSPKVKPINSSSPDVLTHIQILNPYKNMILEKVINIRWTESIDSKGHEVIYAISYSRNNGKTWKNVIRGLSKTDYRWITFFYTDGMNYIIKVEASCSGGYLIETCTDISFSIWNKRIYLSLILLMICILGIFLLQRILKSEI